MAPPHGSGYLIPDNWSSWPRTQRTSKPEALQRRDRTEPQVSTATPATRVESEAALAHKLGDDESEQAYSDTELLESRRPVMQEWADFLNGSNSRLSG